MSHSLALKNTGWDPAKSCLPQCEKQWPGPQLLKHCQNWLWPWMKFHFFIYYPKMPSGPYCTSRQLTSRIYMLCSLKNRLFFNSCFKVLGFPGGSGSKESACNEGDLGLIPALGRPPGEGKGYPLQYSGLENSMDCIVHRFAKTWDTIERLLLSLL